MSNDMFVMFYGLIFCMIICVGAIGGLFVVKQFINLKDAERCHEMSGAFLSVMGTLYAILLGFLIANSISKWISAQSAVELEAGSLAAVFRMSRALPDDTRDAIRKSALDYANIVVDVEYPLMQKQQFAQQAWRPIDKMWVALLDFKPSDDQQSNIQQVSMGAMNDLCKARRSRILYATSGGLSPTLWGVLVLGGIAVVLCAYLFELGAQQHIHIIAVALLAATVAANFYLLLDYSYPFSGMVTVQDLPFTNDRRDFQWYIDHPDN